MSDVICRWKSDLNGPLCGGHSNSMHMLEGDGGYLRSVQQRTSGDGGTSKNVRTPM